MRRLLQLLPSYCQVYLQFALLLLLQLHTPIRSAVAQ